MKPSLRSRLLDRVRTEAVRQDWQGLVAEYGTPLLVLDSAKVVSQCRSFMQHLPGVQPHYAVKAAPHPAILNAVAAAGGAFDVATNAEVDLVRSLGIPMNRCIHTHPIKKTTDIEHAYRAGVRTFVVDNPVEAQKFTGLPADIGILVRLAFRNPHVKSDLSSKFGTEPIDAELLVKHVLAAGAHFRGFSFHVGSQGSSVEPYRTALRTTIDLAGHLQHTLGVTTGTIDIGGGFPVDYREEMPDIAAIGAAVTGVLGDDHPFTLLAEPGRFLSASSMTLLTSVVGSAVRGGRMWHYLDDGLYGTYSNILTEDVHPPIIAMTELRDGPGPDLEPVTLAGPTCDSVDVIARDYPMPTLRPGDVVASPMMGAYTAVTSSRFNGISETPIICVPSN
jgi:ornithine decarboxylase